MIRSNSQIRCYLTADANDALQDLIAYGLDEDLALSVLETLLSDTEMYEIPDAPEAIAVEEAL